mmetsp:Transcript_21429/g.24822  ORF Transcript_21429/g.24822 Transcript_21429/m.24822 type:complete len:433 (+) Transcript_21429:406-1704(+)
MHYKNSLVITYLLSTSFDIDASRTERFLEIKEHVNDVNELQLHIANDQIQQDEEDEKFWERYLQNGMSIAPTRSPTTGTLPTRSPTTTTIPPSEPTSEAPTPAPIPSTLPPFPTVCNGLTMRERAQQLTEIARGASGNIMGRNTPQRMALEWLIQFDLFFVCPDDPKALQRYILAVFYFSTDGDNWDECSAPDDFSDPQSIAQANANCNVVTTPIVGGDLNPSFLPTIEGTDAWLTPVYECNWAGIACRQETLCVDRIEFEANGVGGILPFEVRDLPDLRFLILERGTTAGTIPAEFAQIEDLLFLDLDFNQLTGTIPEELYTVTDLFQLDLNDNLLTGTLSPSIGDLGSLIFLQLSGNDITGTIPDEVGQLTQLLTGSFENTGMTGSIPQALCDSLLSKPTYILITDCSPEGPGLPPKVQCTCCTDCFPDN